MTQHLEPAVFEALKTTVIEDGITREVLLENAPRFTKIANFLFEQAEYEPSRWLSFDGRVLTVAGVNGHIQYEVDRLGTGHYYTGFMHMQRVGGQLNGLYL